jgi:MBG domain (YGX type)
MGSYYISGTGLTTNSGTSALAPWPISKLTSQSWQPGDVINVAQNVTYTTTIGWSASGTPTSPITITRYGMGPNPIFDAGGSGTPVFTFAANVHDVIVDSIIAQNSTSPNGIYFVQTGCYNIKWTNGYINKGVRGINAVRALGGLKVLGNYFSAIADNATHTHGGGSHVQLNNCNGGGIEIGNNFSFEPTPNTGIGDLLSIYQCNGLLGDEILVHDNKARGGSTNTNGYCHIVLGDVGGSHQKGYNNLAANPGMEGFQIQGGTFCYLYNNKGFSDGSNPVSNVGIAYGNYSKAPANNNDIYSNNLCWKRPNGSYLGLYIDTTTSISTASGLAGGPTLATPPGWASNTGANSCDSTVTNTVVPSPLWTGSPWNTTTTGLVFNPITAKTYGNADFAPGATSGNPITYTSSNPAVATIVSGNIHIVGAGTSTITANDGTTTINQLLTVNKAVLTVAANAASKTYGASNPAFSGSITGFVLGETSAVLTTQPSYTSTGTSSSGVGTYPIAPGGAAANNYSFNYVTANLTINQANLTVTANSVSKVYGSVNPGLGVTYSGFVNGDNSSALSPAPSASTSATTGSPAGSYSVIPAGGAAVNYNLIYVDGTLTIGKAPLTITANNQTRQFNSLNPVLTVAYSGFVNGDNAASLTSGPATSTTAVQSSPVGNYAISVSGAASPNYNITFVPGTLTITANTINFGPIPNHVYGDPDFGAGASSSTGITYTSDNPAVAIIVSGLVHVVGAGTANITANNGTTSSTQPLLVTQAPLIATADNHAISVGSAIPLLSVTYSGFVNGDTGSALTTAATATTTATSSSPVGTYPITPAGGSAANYSISYVTGSLIILPTPLELHFGRPVVVLA